MQPARDEKAAPEKPSKLVKDALEGIYPKELIRVTEGITACGRFAWRIDAAKYFWAVPLAKRP